MEDDVNKSVIDLSEGSSSDQLSDNQVDVNEGKSIDPWSSKEIGRREPPFGEELEGPSPLPLQPKPHGAGKTTTPNAVAVAANRLQATGKSCSHPKPSYHPKPAEKVTPKCTYTPVTVATDTSGCLVHAHRSPDNYDNCPPAFTHTPYNPPSNTKLVIGKVNNAVNLLNEWKYRKPFGKKSLGSNFKLLTFLESLRLERLCPTSFHTELPLYLTKRARLESMFKELGKGFTDESVRTVLSFLKPEWIGSEEIAHIRQQFTKSHRVGWNTLKKSPRIVELINLNVLSRKLGVPGTFSLNPTVDEFDGIIDEVARFLQEYSNDQLRVVHLVDALFRSEADEAFIDELVFQDLTKPTITQLRPVAEYLARTGKWREMLPLIHDSIHDLITEESSRYGQSTPQALHCLGLWLATGAESSNPLTWEDVREILYEIHVTGEDLEELGVHHNFLIASSSVERSLEELSLASYEHEASAEDPLPIKKVNRNARHLGRIVVRSSAEEQTGIESTDQPPPPVHAVKNLNAVFEKSSLLGSRQTLHGGSDDEAALLSKKLDPGNPKSILAHAKSVYLTGDYNRTRDILDNFNHHLTVENKMQRANIFGLGICHYREKDYPVAVKYLDELERVALKHNAAGDVALSFIYRGEIHLAQGKYQTAYEMFTRARTAYSTDHVAHLFGIAIFSKTSVIIKAANCQKHLKNISKAIELFHTAVELAVRSRESVESSSTTLDRKHADTLRALYKDEIEARTSLGNLHQNTSDCSRSLEEYRIALKLQEKVDTNCIAYGWAQGNIGSALVGRGKVKEAIPHLTEAYDIAKKFERDYSAVGRAANNLGTALQADKQYSQAEDYFQIALGHSVYCKDEVGQAISLGNIGNVKLLQGELMEALRCYTETLSLGCDDNALITAYQNRAGVYIALAKQLARGNDWDEVSSDVESVQPKEIQSAEIPVQEFTEHHPTENMRLQLVAPVGTYTGLPLDDEEEILANKEWSSPAPSFERGRRTDPIQQQPLTAFDVLSDDLTVKHRKYYLERAKEDLLQSIELIEKKFDTLKGEDTNTLALSLFEVNAKAFYNLQKVLVLLGDPQGALKVAEQNRGRNLGEILWNKRQQASNIPRPLDLRHIWKVVNRERTPVIVLSYIQQSSTMLIHMVFPRAKSDLSCRGEEGTDFYRESGGAVHSEDRLFHTIFHTPALANSIEDEYGSQIPLDNYHFMKVDLPKEDFLNKNYGPFSRDNKEENVSFDQFVMKTLMNYLNQREMELFTPIDYQDDASPLTILFEKIVRTIVKVLEHKLPEEREIIVIADQAAHFFPWPLLQDKSTKVFLGDRYRVRTYPSILTMGVINHQKPSTIELPSEESFLVVGNPATPKFQHGGKDVTLGRLPHSETEALQVAHILETTPLLKEMATKPSVLYRLQTAQIIHIATHSSAVHGYLAFASSVPIVNSAKPVDSKKALIFIDEIQKLHINASLVVLSACDSAHGQLVNEGVNSVARAFLAAGAQSVLVSLVQVPNKSASIFMSMFYRFLTHNEFTTSEAMQKSSMAIRCIKTHTQHIHWGGFQLVGRNIRMKYNKDCHPAKVAALVGETSPFPRLSVIQELEKAIFRRDRTPPRDVVVSVLNRQPSNTSLSFV